MTEAACESETGGKGIGYFVSYVDELRNDIWQNHGQIHIVDFEFYDTNIFNRCEHSNDVLLAIHGWANVHPLLKVIPVEWEYSIPYVCG